MTNTASVVPFAAASLTTTHVESGHHPSVGGLKAAIRGRISPTTRSGPPSGAINRTSLDVESDPRRRNAMVRPSGDQLGL